MTTWATLASDTFTRANGNLNGSTANNVNGGTLSTAWTSAAGFQVSSNALVNASGASGRAYLASMSAVDQQRASITLNGLDTSVLVRYDPATGNGYSYGNLPTGSAAQLSQVVGGVPFSFQGFTTIANGTVITIEADGQNLTVFNNGVQVYTTTDNHYATGVCGVVAFGDTTFSGDNFLAEVVAAAGPATQLVVTTQPAGATTGVALTTQPVFEARDVANLLDTTYTGTITFTGSGAATLGGTLTKAAVGGVITPTTLKLTGGGYPTTITASASGLTSVTTSPLNVPVAPIVSNIDTVTVT